MFKLAKKMDKEIIICVDDEQIVLNSLNTQLRKKFGSRYGYEFAESAEEALRLSQRTLMTLMSNLPGMAYRCRDGRFWDLEFVSEGCQELTGYDMTQGLTNRLRLTTHQELIELRTRAITTSTWTQWCAISSGSPTTRSGKHSSSTATIRACRSRRTDDGDERRRDGQ